MFFLEFVLKTRVKYLAIGILILFCVILFLTSNGDHKAEYEHLDLIQYKKNIASEKAEGYRKLRNIPESSNNVPEDFKVQFISGKEMANEVDNDQKSFQVHKVRITNMERSKVIVDCEDPFSSFGKMIAPGGTYEFRVTDLFAKRHYWCTARYGSAEYIFRAYGEGAPRDNNHITLHKDGAFINGKIMNMEDNPMKNKLPKGPSERDAGGHEQDRQLLFPPQQHEPPMPDHPEEDSNVSNDRGHPIAV